MSVRESLRVDGSAIHHNARVKVYPDGSYDVLVCDRQVFVEDGWEAARRRARDPPEPAPEGAGDEVDGPPEQAPASSQRAQRRARAQVRELALANEFAWFVTLTLDPSRVDRYDMAEITKKLNAWLDNQVRRKGLAYVLVPERHKDGAIHFHGLFNRALAAVDSGHTDREGHRVYNLPGWSLGFTAAIELYGDRERSTAYVCKYIGKQGDKPGGRWYYSGGALRRPQVVYCDMDLRDAMEQPGAYAFTVEAAGAAFVQYRVRGGGTDAG